MMQVCVYEDAVRKTSFKVQMQRKKKQVVL